jgi:hypothetical protein
MSCHRTNRTSSSFAADSPWGQGAGCGRPHWKPLEIAAMVFAFVLFWPLGLAILLGVLWRRSQGYEGDVFDFAREKWTGVQKDLGFGAADFSASWRPSGNVAFDEWRERELARLEEERRKLAEAEREFAEHIGELRRARDREEFDSFMRARKGGTHGA